MTLLRGPLRYLIGADADAMPHGNADEVIEVPYDCNEPPAQGAAIGYCNLFDENNTGHYGPYLHESDTAADYDEGQIDPKGPGWRKNLIAQFERRSKAGFEFVELDNPDAYHMDAVLDAVNLAQYYKLKVVAKNPGIVEHAHDYIVHPNVVAMIVEKGGGTCDGMQQLRMMARKPAMPVWFVSFGNGRAWALARRNAIQFRGYLMMSVTYSSEGEYENSIDVLRPQRPK